MRNGMISLLTSTDPDRPSLLNRENLLVIFLLAIGLSSLVFYLLPPGYYDRRANLMTTVGMLAMLPLAYRPRFHAFVVHGAAFICLALVTYIACESGGVNSTAVVWLNVLSIPVLLLLGPRATLVWIALSLVTIGVLFVATLSGWISGHAYISRQAVPWALMNHTMAVGNMMLAVFLYDHLHARQLKQLAQRNEEIKATHQALLQAQAHKDEFMAAVGHELRTPMNAILGFNGVLRQELADQPAQVVVVDHIRRSTEHLLRVVNDILDFSQLQAGKLVLHAVDFELAPLMQDALRTGQDKAADKGLTWSGQIDANVPPRVHADRQRLLQILRNLLDNALKFTDQGGVQLHISCQKGALRFEVVDTGRGIAPQLQGQIFRRFEHADVQTTRAYGGTGLGLSICEKLVTLQGGRIGLQSEEGQGATFWFEIPCQEAKTSPQTQPDDHPGLQDEALRMLVVDDNVMNLMVARLQLKKCWPKAHVETAESAAQALVLLDEQRFDVALVDMVMPDMDGLQLTAQIRRQFPAITARMPILALTANTNPVDRQRCRDAGMDDVLDKPMDLDTLVRSVSRHIRKARA